MKFYGTESETFAKLTDGTLYIVQSVDFSPGKHYEKITQLPEGVEELDPRLCADLELPDFMSNFTSKVYIGAAGDPAVGIQATTIEIDLRYDVDNVDRESDRGILRETFGELLGEPVTVTFEDEIKDREVID